jgi:hypothetical protein
VTAVGARVLAMQKSTDVSVHVFGEGVYVGNRIPDVSPFRELEIKNPYIQLDSGKGVWGFQCWWGDLEAAQKAIGDKTVFKVEITDEDEIKPVEEP